MSVSLCDAAMAGNVEEVLQLFKNFQAPKSFAVLFDHIYIDHNNLVFLTPTSSHQPMSPPPPIKFNIQVLIRLNMGEDVNQKHYPRFVLSETYLSFYKIER